MFRALSLLFYTHDIKGDYFRLFFSQQLTKCWRGATRCKSHPSDWPPNYMFVCCCFFYCNRNSGRKKSVCSYITALACTEAAQRRGCLQPVNIQPVWHCNWATFDRPAFSFLSVRYVLHPLLFRHYEKFEGKRKIQKQNVTWTRPLAHVNKPCNHPPIKYLETRQSDYAFRCVDMGRDRAAQRAKGLLNSRTAPGSSSMIAFDFFFDSNHFWSVGFEVKTMSCHYCNARI